MRSSGVQTVGPNCLDSNPNSSLTSRITLGESLHLSFLICEMGMLMIVVPTSEGRRGDLKRQYKNIKHCVNRVFLFSIFYNALISQGPLDLAREELPLPGLAHS